MAQTVLPGLCWRSEDSSRTTGPSSPEIQDMPMSEAAHSPDNSSDIQPGEFALNSSASVHDLKERELQNRAPGQC